MQYRTLGQSGIKVSPICLGTMMFGRETAPAQARKIIEHAHGAGVNFIDTADQYTSGRSEEVVGAAIKTRRFDWVLATKAGNPSDDDPNRRGLGRRWLLRAAEESLVRLKTDWIDIYYLHLEDHTTPLEETVSAIGELISQGKIRYFGVSNFRGWRIAEIVRLCGIMGVPKPVVSQPYYNAFNRQPELEQLPVCGHYGIGVVPYSPLARGVLTGKYASGAKPVAGSRAGRGDTRMLESEWRPESLTLAQKVAERAQMLGVSGVDLAVGWVLNNRFVTSVLAGPRTLDQWRSYLKALDYVFSAEDEAFFESLVAAGHPSSPGYNDPRYPVEGRVTHTEPVAGS